MDIKQRAVDIVTKVEQKDNDYGSAFAKGVEEFGWYEYLVALGHKYRRIKALTIENKEQQVKDESVKDTITDIIGYSLQMLSVLDKE